MSGAMVCATMGEIMRRQLLALAGASLICATSTAAMAQSRIEVGRTVNGALETRDARLSDGSYYDCYVMRIDRTQSVLITLRSEAFDTYMAAGYGGDCSGEAAETNDDGPSMGTDSSLELEFQPGEYFIRANSLSPDKTGRYTLSLEPIQGGSDSGSDGVTTLEGTLSRSDPQLDDDSYYDCIEVQGRAGQGLVVGMESEDFDTYLVLLEGPGCQGASVASNDDGEDLGTNSLLTVTLPNDGVYSIRANSLGGEETGAYLLHYVLE